MHIYVISAVGLLFTSLNLKLFVTTIVHHLSHFYLFYSLSQLALAHRKQVSGLVHKYVYEYLFSLCLSLKSPSANINKEQIETHSVSEIPSWCIRKPKIDLSLHSEKKSESNPHLLKQNFHELQSYYSDHEHIIQIDLKMKKK